MEAKLQEQVEFRVKRISELETAPAYKGQSLAEARLQEQVDLLTRQNTELDVTAKNEQKR